MATKIPTWLNLDTGAHPNDCGVCVEECLALLLGQDKTDHPDRVHPIIRDLAIRANDAERDPKKRRLLARTLACQVDTDDVSEEVTNGLAAFVCRFSADRLPEGTDERVGAALTAAAECLEDRNPESIERAARAAEAAEAAWAARAAFYADLLVAVIAEFDRITGRTECYTFTTADWDRVRHAAPIGEDEDGMVTTGYVVSVGAMHRALALARMGTPDPIPSKALAALAAPSDTDRQGEG